MLIFYIVAIGRLYLFNFLFLIYLELEHPSPAELDVIDRLVAVEATEAAKRLTHIVQVGHTTHSHSAGRSHNSLT